MKEGTIMPAYAISLQQQILKDFSTTLPDCKQSFLVSSLSTSYFSLEKKKFHYILRFLIFVSVIKYCILYETENIKSTKNYARKSLFLT